MQYGHDCGFDPCFSGYGYPVAGANTGNCCGFSGGFALIVVLFILLIIIGASCYGAW
ncbi:YjcZ family sporulation protein [Cytobacillus solani]|uniref:YjcZ family sporulation protein n=1 Tax=Cytobacillus solani TaxID=1637975 RepID=UPI0011533EB1|nr:YjcZ family sporulation protein [Cytobacillus solani]